MGAEDRRHSFPVLGSAGGGGGDGEKEREREKDKGLEGRGTYDKERDPRRRGR